jgi:hypothetical protein
MPIQEVASTLQAGDGTRDGCVAPTCGLEQLLERLVGQASESGESLPAAEEGPQAPGKREDHVAMGDGVQDLLRDELAEGRLPLRMARGAQTALLAREGEQVLVPALGASNTSEAMGQNPTALETLQGAGDDRPERAKSGRVAVVVQVEEGVRVARDQLPERRGLGFAGAIRRRALGASRGAGGLATQKRQGTGHGRTLPFGHWQFHEAMVLPLRVPSVSG